MIHYSGHLMKFDSVTYGNFKLTCLSVSHIFRLENESTYIYIKIFAKFWLIRIACCAYKLIVFVSNTYSLNRQINYGFLKKNWYKNKAYLRKTLPGRVGSFIVAVQNTFVKRSVLFWLLNRRRKKIQVLIRNPLCNL